MVVVLCAPGDVMEWFRAAPIVGVLCAVCVAALVYVHAMPGDWSAAGAGRVVGYWLALFIVAMLFAAASRSPRLSGAIAAMILTAIVYAGAMVA